MAFDLPQRRSAKIVQTQKRSIPLEQILAVQGQNPLAMGIETAGNALGQAIQKRAEIRRQAQQVAQLAALAGEQPPQDIALTPDLYEKGLTLKSATDAKRAAAAKERTGLEFQLEKLRSGYSETDPLTGKISTFPGVQGLNIAYDPSGNPFAQREENYIPKIEPKGSKSGGRGMNPTLVGNTPDGLSISYNPRTRQNELPDGTAYSGMVLPKNVGSEEQRRQALVSGTKTSIADIRSNLTPSVLNELKAIRLSPGRIYSQLASPQAKRLYINLREALANEIYLKTGATANEQELENSAISYLAALNDNPNDFLGRMDLLERNVLPFDARAQGLKPMQSPGLSDKKKSLVDKLQL